VFNLGGLSSLWSPRLLIAGHVSASEAAALRRALAQREDELNRVRRGLAGASQVHPRNHMSA